MAHKPPKEKILRDEAEEADMYDRVFFCGTFSDGFIQLIKMIIIVMIFYNYKEKIKLIVT